MGKTGVTCRRLLAAVALLSAGVGTGCAVSDSDVHRWETTEGGPEKLYAIVTHDKYSWALREEAAHVAGAHATAQRQAHRAGVPGDGVRGGGGEGAAGALGADRRGAEAHRGRHRAQAHRHPPAAAAAHAGRGAGPTRIGHPRTKTRRSAMLSHEPPLVSDDKTKAESGSPPSRRGSRPTSRTASTTARSSSREQMMRCWAPQRQAAARQHHRGQLRRTTRRASSSPTSATTTPRREPVRPWSRS